MRERFFGSDDEGQVKGLFQHFAVDGRWATGNENVHRADPIGRLEACRRIYIYIYFFKKSRSSPFHSALSVAAVIFTHFQWILRWFVSGYLRELFEIADRTFQADHRQSQGISRVAKHPPYFFFFFSLITADCTKKTHWYSL